MIRRVEKSERALSLEITRAGNLVRGSYSQPVTGWITLELSLRRGSITRYEDFLFVYHTKRKGLKRPTQQKLRGFDDLWRLVPPRSVGKFGIPKFCEKIFKFLVKRPVALQFSKRRNTLLKFLIINVKLMLLKIFLFKRSKGVGMSKNTTLRMFIRLIKFFYKIKMCQAKSLIDVTSIINKLIKNNLIYGLNNKNRRICKQSKIC